MTDQIEQTPVSGLVMELENYHASTSVVPSDRVTACSHLLAHQDADRQNTALERIATALEKLASIGVDYGAPNNTPEQCEAHTCSYYDHYLAFGGPDLTHEGYHAVEREFYRHTKYDSHRNANVMCGMCASLEKRLRA